MENIHKAEELIKQIVQDFVFREKLSSTEQLYMQQLVPFDTEREFTLNEYLDSFREIASFYSGELAKNIKQYLLLNDLLAKDNARSIKEELMLFRRFFHFLLQEIKSKKITEINEKRLDYVILKIDAYLKKYLPYISM